MAQPTPADTESAELVATRTDATHGLAALRKAWDCVWWSVRAHVADVHLLPRGEALEPPPARWLEGSPSEREPAQAAPEPPSGS
jgi:hypothetical protein